MESPTTKTRFGNERSGTRQADQWRWFLPGCLVLATMLRVIAAEWGRDIADVGAYFGHVSLVNQGINIYESSTQYPYLPGWLVVEVLTNKLSVLTGLAFWRCIRWLIILCDIGVAALLFLLLKDRGRRAQLAAFVAYLFSPIAIIVTGIHGQFDSVCAIFALLSYLLFKNRRSPALIGVIVGLAVGIKPQAALLLPIYAWQYRSRLSHVLAVACGSFAMIGVIAYPFLLDSALPLASKIGGYNSVNDQGLGGLLRSLWLIRAKNFYLPGPFGEEICALTKPLVLILLLFCFACAPSVSVPHSVALGYLAFLALYGGVGTQHLTWPLPWLFLTALPVRRVMFFACATAFGAIGFYLVYWPELVPGAGVTGMNDHFELCFVIGQLISWVAILITFISLLRLSSPPKGVSWKCLRYGSLAAFAIFGYPLALRMFWIIKEWIRFVPSGG